MCYIGVSIDRHYKKRLDTVRDFSDFLAYASREISFLKTDILTVVSNYIKGRTSPLSDALAKIKDSYEKGEKLTIENPYISAEDKEIIVRFFEGIKKSDYKEQEKLFQKTIVEAGERVRISEKQKKEKGELIKKLCILAGVGLMILIV